MMVILAKQSGPLTNQHGRHKSVCHLLGKGLVYLFLLLFKEVSTSFFPLVSLVPIIGIFGGAVVPLYKGMMSQMVDPDERGKDFFAVFLEQGYFPPSLPPLFPTLSAPELLN